MYNTIKKFILKINKKENHFYAYIVHASEKEVYILISVNWYGIIQKD